MSKNQKFNKKLYQKSNKFLYFKIIAQKILGVAAIIYALYLGYIDLLEHEWRYVTLTDKEVKQYAINEEEALKLYQLIKDTHDILTKHHIDYWLEGGTLIGAVRHKGVIPFDDDLDIGIMHHNELKLQDTIPDFEKLGYDIINKQIYHICDKNGPCLDIFIFHRKNDKFIHTNLSVRGKYPRDFFYEDELLPLKKYQFGKLELYGPGQAKGYLDRQYPEWDKYAIIQQPHRRHIRLSGIEKKTKYILTPELLKPAGPLGPLIDKVEMGHVTTTNKSLKENSNTEN